MIWYFLKVLNRSSDNFNYVGFPLSTFRKGGGMAWVFCWLNHVNFGFSLTECDIRKDALSWVVW